MILPLYLDVSHGEAEVKEEGALYKTINLHGKTFELYYGYYEDCERQNPNIDPMPIYPDFLKNPQYTDDGFPFVTKMQDVCSFYKGEEQKFKECAECQYYLHGNELLGICVCPKNKKEEGHKDDG